MRRKLNCVECGEALTGRQQQFCSDRCRKRYSRRQDKEQVATTARQIVEAAQSQGVEPPPLGVSSVAKAAASNNSLLTLQALRDKLAFEIDLSEHPKDLATLAARLMDSLERIDQKQDDTVTSGGALDELNRRRQARRGAAT